VILLLYFGVTLASHVAFNIIDVAGYICREKGSATGLAKGEKRVVTFNTASICTATGIQLDKRGRYLIVLKSREPQWYDGNIRTSPAGFYSLEARAWWRKVLMVTVLPLRRELIRPWFRVVAHTGGAGGEESFLDPDPKDKSIEEVLKATRDGELFLFVNDAVLAIPGLFDAFYRDNVGSAEVTVTRR